MDEKLRKLLEETPERSPRSKLEPHTEVIRELRKKRRTYQEIAVFFREHLQLTVAPSTIHEFVKTRARQARNRPVSVVELPEAKTQQTVSGGTTTALLPASKEAAREPIQSAKNQLSNSEKERLRFEFDPQKPLILQPKRKEK